MGVARGVGVSAGGSASLPAANDGDQYEGQYDAECREPTNSCAFVRHIRVPFESNAVAELNGACGSSLLYLESFLCGTVEAYHAFIPVETEKCQERNAKLRWERVSVCLDPDQRDHL